MDLKQLLARGCVNKKIGLLGGSFNPAHDGHVQMSLFALARLKLDEVWWLVSPQNPHKAKENMGVLEKRIAYARALARTHTGIIVTAIEEELGTQYSIDTVHALKEKFPDTKFVWLMGEDNWRSFHTWRSWEGILLQLPIAVFRRSGYSESRQGDEVSSLYANAELPLTSVENLAVSPPPVWVVLDNEPNNLSATQIRESSQPTL